MTTSAVTFRWTGGKKWLLPYLHSMEECFELFAGSGSVALTRAKTAHLNDLCVPLMKCFAELKAGSASFLSDAEVLFNQVQTASDPATAFYALRDRFNTAPMSDRDRSLAFLVVLLSGFNGLWREGPGGCNVPFGGKRRFPRHLKQHFPGHKLGRLSSDDWKVAVIPNDTCVVFVDPPYTTTFVSYQTSGWTGNDDRDLFSALAKLRNPVVVTCLRTQTNVQLLQSFGFRGISFDKKYSNGAQGTVEKGEIVAFNDLGQQFVDLQKLQAEMQHCVIF